jgi:hypothetical protein
MAPLLFWIISKVNIRFNIGHPWHPLKGKFNSWSRLDSTQEYAKKKNTSSSPMKFTYTQSRFRIGFGTHLQLECQWSLHRDLRSSMYSQSVGVVENVKKSLYLYEGKWIHVQVKWIRKTILNFAKFLNSNICVFIDDIMFKLIWFLIYFTKSDLFL